MRRWRSRNRQVSVTRGMPSHRMLMYPGAEIEMEHLRAPTGAPKAWHGDNFSGTRRSSPVYPTMDRQYTSKRKIVTTS